MDEALVSGQLDALYPTGLREELYSDERPGPRDSVATHLRLIEGFEHEEMEIGKSVQIYFTITWSLV